jgi:hypothetical protein
VRGYGRAAATRARGVLWPGVIRFVPNRWLGGCELVHTKGEKLAYWRSNCRSKLIAGHGIQSSRSSSGARFLSVFV